MYNPNRKLKLFGLNINHLYHYKSKILITIFIILFLIICYFLFLIYDNYTHDLPRKWRPPITPTIGKSPRISRKGHFIFDQSKMNTVVCKPEPNFYNVNGKKYRYYLTVYASFKDEALTLNEWIEHYIWQGVDHFFLIDNGSTDDSLSILEPYIRRGIVSYQYRPKRYQQQTHLRETYRDYIHGNTFWFLQADIDEFWFAPKSNLVDWLRRNEDKPYIRSQWWIFTSFLAAHPRSVRQTNLLTEGISSLDRAKGKWIAQTEFIKDPRVVDIHYIQKPVTPFMENDEIRIYHYQVQSMEFFTKSKLKRPSVQNPLKYETRWGSIHNAWGVLDDLNRRCKETHHVLAELVKQYEASTEYKTFEHFRKCI